MQITKRKKKQNKTKKHNGCIILGLSIMSTEESNVEVVDYYENIRIISIEKSIRDLNLIQRVRSVT